MSSDFSGFAPNWYEGQQNAGLGVYIATGLINGIQVNGQVVYVAPSATSYIWVEANGTVSSGAVVPGGADAIAIVVSGLVTVGGNGPAVFFNPLGQWAGLSQEQGILSITDLRYNRLSDFLLLEDNSFIFLETSITDAILLEN